MASKSEVKKGTITPVITTDADKVPSSKAVRDNLYFNANIPGRYTYYTPGTTPTLSVTDEVKVLAYAHLTVADLFVGGRIICNYANKSIQIPKEAEALAYIKLDPSTGTATGLHYHAFSLSAGGTHTNDNLQLSSTEAFATALPIAFIGRGDTSVFTDLLLIGSSGDNSQYKALTTTFNSRIDSLSIPFKSPLENSAAQGTTVSTVISKKIYERYDRIHLKTRHQSSAGTLSYYLRILDPSQSNQILFSYGFSNQADTDKEVSVKFDNVDWSNIGKGLTLALYAVKSGSSTPVTLTVSESTLYRDLAFNLHDIPMVSRREAEEMVHDSDFITKRICKVGQNESLGMVLDTLNQSFYSNGYSKYESIVTLDKGLEAPFDGYVDTITVDVANVGVYRIYVGLLDQRNRFITSLVREVTIPKAGMNVLEGLMLPISQGEQIGISELNSAMQSGVRYASLTSESDVQMLYANSYTGTLAKLSTQYGALITLSYDIISLESIFARSRKVEELESLVMQQREQINALQYISGSDGQKYKLKVVDGELAIRNVAYKNVLAIGNSLTSHYTAESSLGYYGDDGWAMASTNKELTTWTGFLKTILEQKQQDVTVHPKSVYNFEVNMLTADLDTLFATYQTEDIDLIVLRFGENAVYKDTDYEGTVRIIHYLQEMFPLADIVMTSMFWHNAEKEMAFQKAAVATNCQYVPFGAIADKCMLGQMLMGKDNVLHPVTHNGVANHCTDVCFFDFANILAGALGYDQIGGKHTVTVNTANDYGLNSTSQIYRGYVTILTYGTSSPSMTVTTASGDTVQTQTFNLSDTAWINTPSKIPTYAVVFQMPDEDVTVTY